MDVFIIGKLIKEFRERQKISQEELSFGLCAVSTLSRIENSQNTPTQKLANALLERMGVSIPTNNFPMTQLEVKRWNIEREISNMALGLRNFEYADLLEEYKKLGDMDFFDEQFYLFYLALYKLNHDSDYDSVMNDLIESIKKTIPDYKDEFNFSRRYFTGFELTIFNNIALIESKRGNIERGIYILEHLKEYYESKSVDDELVGRCLPTIILNLSNWKGQLGFIEEALDLTEQGLKISSKYDYLGTFSCFVFNKGYGLCKLGKKEEGKFHLKNAFEIMRYRENPELSELIPQVNKEFGFNFNL